ncbi:hypothetical protein MCOR27_001033 [Pyricularia oryzae]|uniref:Uncharacterized protein n=4 Tax=Pyricularia oryzae TaxID=318829 RepID=G4MYD4_PYRO7|nr:uncharacterized protein MGG_15820 [Pyricularia oryzae 70-15]ELQ44243.1 hypothetical protein OOU_Y34scaffold00094g33 [Pyricularia oryzae Y34]KAI6273949.1 hypothetical protein MCOR26_006698 [Pyricularia oryzae]EHA55269.1 hypothetical protein MGG_15820 [Pyricularia oryzae 70-15]KAI6288362.1 hypothetical protein MCOR27_001033 [Pyricularia oryzae]KAI6329605.1 hypothetical protein MCOR30_005477 [Pyricularia oryzae]
MRVKKLLPGKSWLVVPSVWFAFSFLCDYTLWGNAKTSTLQAVKSEKNVQSVAVWWAFGTLCNEGPVTPCVRSC